MGNTFGHLFRVTTFGESHGGGVGVVVDGCPPRLELSEADIQKELDRRRPGQSRLTTPRQESDRCEILSGVFEGKTLGTPIAILVRNKDTRPEDYAEMAQVYRPSHADATYDGKYGIRNWQGVGVPRHGKPLGGLQRGRSPAKFWLKSRVPKSLPTSSGSRTLKPLLILIPWQRLPLRRISCAVPMPPPQKR